ncbi:ATP-binding protein [Pseudoalteromonas spongiae]|uniref:histidine kinase n=1 Tax=Pseudoalteromonas spongiae TaxID=298657 RepID=A0ABU8EXD5_9GAMM
MERLNANDMLRVVNELLSSKNAAELLVKLQLGLRPIAEISDILVLTQDANQLCALTSTFEPLCGVCLLEPSFVKKVFERNVCAANICQLPNDWILPSHCNETVIFVANNFAERKGVFVLFIKGGDDIGRMENALSSVDTLFRQAFLQLDQQHQMSQMLLDRTYALTQSQQRFQAYAELASDWFWETDESMCFTYLSFLEQTKPSNFSHFLHKSPLNIRSDSESTQFKKWEHFLHLVRQHSEIHEFEFEAIDNQGHRVWVSISGKAKFNADNSFAGYLGIAKDISFAKQREYDLKLAKEKAESANKAKSHFLAVMSHEIRTPMNAILGILELLEDTQPNEKQLELIDFMRDSAKLLQGVISDTLDFAKIESGTLALENSNINLHKLIKNLVQQFETQAVKKGIHFNAILGGGVPEQINTDGVRLSQVLLNLLGNAFKFTLEGEVSLLVNRSDTELFITVKDTGVGIDEAQIQTLFEPFSQLHDKQVGRQQGVGLGLSITKRLLELMEGKIECASEIGVGTEFIVTIPLIPLITADGHVKDAEIENSIPSYRILVAEDNPANQFIIKAILEKRNHMVVLADNGESAVAAVKKSRFDLVLMDMVMPVMDGVTAARTIRTELGELAPPIIALTANAGLADKTKCLNAGMQDVLTKPLNSALLDEKIKALFS